MEINYQYYHLFVRLIGNDSWDKITMPEDNFLLP